MKIWFDILTPKQYLFFEYFIHKLKKQHTIISTSRKYEQVNNITQYGNIKPILIGKHGGSRKQDKLVASLERSKLLTKKIGRFNPDLLISFCSPEASRVAFGLGIQHIAFSDSPQAKAVMKLSLPYVTKLLTPWIFSKDDFKEYNIDLKDIIKYKAIDASVIIKNYKNSKQKKVNAKKIILIRPEEIEASYVQQKSKTNETIKKIVENFPNEKKIVLSRYKKQSDDLKRMFGRKILLYTKPINGEKYLMKADCFIGSGGTMTAESALLGIPTISLNSIPNKIEEFLVKKKVLVRNNIPDKITKEITQIFNNDDIVRKRKENAKKIVSSFEDPYKILLKTIKTL